MADRVTGDQTDNVVCRTSAYYASPTTNCCGCPEDAFAVVLSFPFAIGRTLFSRTAVLFCLPHLRGGTTPLSYSISFYFFLLFSVFSLSRSFFSLSTHWIASICMPYLSYPVRRHVIPLPTLLTRLVCSISVVVL